MSQKAGERSSTRLAIRASLTPVNDERQLLLQSPYVLQLHPTQQPQHNHKKSSHADANGGPQTYHAERRSSTSSLSSLSPLSSDEPELLAGGSGEFVDGSVPKSRKKKESDSPTTATSSVGESRFYLSDGRLWLNWIYPLLSFIYRYLKLRSEEGQEDIKEAKRLRRKRHSWYV